MKASSFGPGPKNPRARPGCRSSCWGCSRSHRSDQRSSGLRGLGGPIGVH